MGTKMESGPQAPEGNTAPGCGQSVPGLSIVCVFNDLKVRKDCLDRSINAYAGTLDVDYIPVDNTGHAFSSAGAALNHGAQLARHHVVVFAHQDVYLHSLDRLAAAASELSHGGWGLLGAHGVTAHGRITGRMRDRTQLIGAAAHMPVEVDSVDEVLFMAPRELLRAESLAEDPRIAWHAYAVEFGLRMRHLGKKVGAIDMAITHNSLTINMVRLDVAHRHVRGVYPDLMPIRTTCGIIRSSRWKFLELSVMRRHRWRVKWLWQCLLAARARRAFTGTIVLSDIRREVDLLNFSADRPLHLLNLDPIRGFCEYSSEPLRIHRYERPVIMSAVGDMEGTLASIAELPEATNVLVADLNLADVETIVSHRDGVRDWVLGVQTGSHWLLSGPVLLDLPPQWSHRPGRPLGSRRWKQGQPQVEAASRNR